MQTHPQPFDKHDERILGEIAKHYAGPDYARYHSFLDIGCHIGGWASYVLQRKPQAVIMGIDVCATSVELARHNVPQAGIVHGHCGYEDGDFIQYRAGLNMGANRIVPRDHDLPQGTEREIASPKYSIESLGLFDVIKIDVEGSEYDILLNCEDRTLQHAKIIIGEYHSGYPAFESRLWPRLRQHFSLRHIDSDSERGIFWMEKLISVGH